MVASRPTVMAPPRTSAAPRAFLAQWRARPHRRLVGVSVVCVESHEGRRIRAREAHQRLHAAFRDLDTDGALLTRTWAPAIDPEPVVTSVLNPPREGRASGRTLGTRGGPKSPNGAVYFHALFTRFRVYEPSFRESKAFKIVLFEKTLSFLGFNFPPVWDHRLTSAPPLTPYRHRVRRPHQAVRRARALRPPTRRGLRRRAHGAVPVRRTGRDDLSRLSPIRERQGAKHTTSVVSRRGHRQTHWRRVQIRLVIRQSPNTKAHIEG